MFNFSKMCVECKKSFTHETLYWIKETDIGGKPTTKIFCGPYCSNDYMTKKRKESLKK